MSSAYPLRPRLEDDRLRRGRRFLVNRVSYPIRRRPDFFIIGEMKSGTSSLFAYLRWHDKLIAPNRKEIHYFSVGHHLGPRWYRAHFPVDRRNGSITGEACPDYLFSPTAAQRIRSEFPNARLIALLREPVERALSHYFHEVRWGREYLPVMEALEVEEQRLAGADPATADGLETYLHASYKRRGCYAQQLEHYFSAFPREQILVLGSQRLFTSPGAVLNETLAFLNLSPIEVPPERFEVRNPGTNREQVPAEVYDYLNRYYEEPNRRLNALLGHPLDW